MPDSPDVARNSMRMKDGSYRSVASPSEVGNYLNLAVRPFPDGRKALAFSMHGLWSCTMTPYVFRAWSNRILAVVPEGYIVIQADKDGGDVFVDACRVRNVVGMSSSRRSVAVLELVEGALFDLKVAEGVTAARASFDEATRQLAMAADDARQVAAVANAIEHAALPEGHAADAEDTDGADPDLDRVGRFVPVLERQIGGRNVLSVIARDVHVFVGGSYRFAHWFKEQVERCRLHDGEDYQEEVFQRNLKNPSAGRPRRDYVLTLDAAKEIGMVDKGPRGKELRQYFLECERRLASGDAASQAASTAVAVLPVRLAAASPTMPRLSAETLPLSIQSYLWTKGFGRGGVGFHVADDLGGLSLTQAQKDLVATLVTAGDPACWFCRHPETGDLLFSRPALDGWWAAHEGEIIAASLGK